MRPGAIVVGLAACALLGELSCFGHSLTQSKVSATTTTADSAHGRPSSPPALRLTLLEQRLQPVIQRGSPGTEGNAHGLEGGCVLKLGGVYHLFTSEMVGEPFWVKMKLGHWTSRDRLTWKRQGTMYESSGEPTGVDPRAALWAPMPIYNQAEGRWNLFYVAYRAPIGDDGWHGRIWRAASRVKGPEGIDGPWDDVAVVMEPGPRSDPWEGSQGTDSFFPDPAGAESHRGKPPPVGLPLPVTSTNWTTTD